MKNVTVVATGGPLGARVHGVDAHTEMDPETVTQLEQALLDHLLLVFPGQRLTDAELVHFAAHFGEPVPHVREQPQRSIDEVFVVSNVQRDGKPIGALGNGELTFHSDLSYLSRPGSLSFVYAVEVPREGGDTQWANCYAAYDALPEHLKTRLLDLRAVHRHGEDAQNPKEPVSHPVIRTHPRSGKRATFVSPQFTRYFEGLARAESDALLAEVLAHVTDARFVWTHHWTVGDLVVWDNRCTLHRREPFAANQRRILKRTQMFGEIPYLALP